jgi:FdrA protein
MIATVEVLSGHYFDSIRLLQISGAAAALPGVDGVLVAMGTALNLGLLEEMGFDRSHASGAGPDDLLVAIAAADPPAHAAARRMVEEHLTTPAPVPTSGLFEAPPPRTVGGAGRMIDATMALISVPGAHAFVEAIDALRHGLHVMVFSDNVPIDQEVLLKREGVARGLLVMGPDCGTAIVNGVGLGFANAVDPGPIGICGASGTGIQHLCCLFDAAGVGVRHALGTGSRDLSAPVGAVSTLAALTALDADPAVEVIVVVSKPPDPEVATAVEEAVARCRTPVVMALLGTPGVTLEATAEQALAVLGTALPELPVWRSAVVPVPRPGNLVGNFSGGTLRAEAAAVAAATLGPIDFEPAVPGHRMVDYGDDRFTRGRPHPMIDPGLRIEGLAAAATDPTTAVVLFDVVLGYGAHQDPSGALAPSVRALADRGIPVVASLCGTRRDPQNLNMQADTLSAAGAEVHLSNAAAARRAVALIGAGSP